MLLLPPLPDRQQQQLMVAPSPASHIESAFTCLRVVVESCTLSSIAALHSSAAGQAQSPDVPVTSSTALHEISRSVRNVLQLACRFCSNANRLVREDCIAGAFYLSRSNVKKYAAVIPSAKFSSVLSCFSFSLFLKPHRACSFLLPPVVPAPSPSPQHLARARNQI